MSDDAAADGSTKPSGSVPVFAPISAPILRSVDPVKVARFLRERERYEIEIEAKQMEVPTLKSLPYTASIDRTLLKSLFYMGEFDTLAPGAGTAKDLSNDHIKSYIESLVSRSDPSTIDPTIIKSALVGFSMPTKILDAKARITTYCADFFERMESVGCDGFPEANPKKTVRLLCSRLEPQALKKEMRERLDYDESLEKSVKLFIKVLTQEAINCQAYGTTKQADTVSLKKKERDQESSRGSGSAKGGSTSTQSKSQKPVCLFPPHKEKGLRHYLKDCRDCPKDMKDKLFEDMRATKKDGIKRAALPSSKAPDSSIIFSATFANKVRTTVCADIGADASLMDTALLDTIQRAGIDALVEKLTPPRTFNMAASNSDGSTNTISCDQAVTINTQLHIRHGSALILRGLRWLVTSQSVGEPLLGRPVLEALGLDCHKVLAAAADRHGGSVDISTLVGSQSDFSTGRIGRVLDGVFHADGGADDADLDEDDGWLDLGPEDPVEKERVLKSKLQEAKERGLSTKGYKDLENLLREYGDTIKLRLDAGKPADIEPLRVSVKPDSAPIRAKQRRYPQPKREFITRYVRELLKLGFVKPVTSPEWVSAPLVVPKRPPAMYRLTVDYRPVNAVTRPTFWPMPNIEAELADTRGSTAFAGIDFCSGYWQAPLHPESQPLFAFSTPDGVVMPTRTTQGGCNSAANFQEKVEQCFTELKDHLKAWIDDFMLFAPTEEDLLRILRRFFEICRKRRLIVSLPKSDFYLSEVIWCGRIVDAKGVRFHPKNIAGLIDSDPPRTAGELCEYVHGVNWISLSIPRFAERVAPLRDLLETAYAKAGGSRKKKSIAKIPLADLGWEEAHVKAFKDLQVQIQQSTRLTHRDPSKTLCVHTDASDKYWAVAATQCDPDELGKPLIDQKHYPLAFLSSAFNEREEHWSTYEREAYAVVQAFRKLDYLLACDPTTRVFTDHRNLLFVFNPVAMEPSLGRHKVLKVVRWALFLSSFNYRIEHVPGVSNTWPDIMTRWMRGYRKPPAIRRIAPLIPFSGITHNPDDIGFKWPNPTEIAAVQKRFDHKAPKGAKKDETNLLLINGAVWIPSDAVDLKLRLLTIAHAGGAGHRGADPTWHALRNEFYWIDQREDVRSFVSSCLLCVLSKSGSKVPRPLSTTIHATKPNEVIHFDYLFLGTSSAKAKYALVVKDDLSGYVWLDPSPSADSEHTASVLARWTRVFTAPEVWVSDQGSHFKNEVLQHLAKIYGIRHNLTVAYSPWVNGTVESVMRSVLSAIRAMLAELKLAPQDWPSVLPAIASTLNESSLDRLGRRPDGAARSPLEVMTGISPKRPIVRILPPSASFIESKTLSHAHAAQIVKISDLQASLDKIHKDVERLVSKRREQAVAKHNLSTNIVLPSFNVGDFVVVRRASDRGHKLRFKWFGPLRITAVHSPLVYSVTSLSNGKTERVHCARILKYDDSLQGSTVPQEMIDIALRTEARYEVVEKILDIGEAPDGIFFQVQWDGLPDKEDWTWQPAADLYADIPDGVRHFLSTCRKKTLVSKLKLQLSIST